MESHIPRFLAHFEHVEGRSVFAMSRRDWTSFGVSAGSPVQSDVACTPISNVAQSAFVIAATAVTLSAPADQIHIYRWDPVDAPSPINLDKYSVWVDLSAHPDYGTLVKAASANDDKELRSFLCEHVFIAYVSTYARAPDNRDPPALTLGLLHALRARQGDSKVDGMTAQIGGQGHDG